MEIGGVLQRLERGLIVSCQPVPGGPMDQAEIVRAFALAALDGGAVGLRIESATYVAAVRAATPVPIIGLVKRDLEESPVRITPWPQDVRDLLAAGADIVAFDATRRQRPVPVGDLVAAISSGGGLAMADCACLADAEAALAAGAAILGSTLSGYTGGPEPRTPDLALVAGMARLGAWAVAEGRIRTPNEAAMALKFGARAVVVGSAITRPEHVTQWFVEAMAGAAAAAPTA
jgi:putative N-acetylmannosamine-6-phosphate epimerase